MQVADGDAEPAVVGTDDVEMEAGGAGDVQLRLLAGVGSLIVLTAGFCPGRLCNEKEMISWDSKNLRIMIILRPFMRDKRRRRSSPLSKCSMFCSISGRSRVFSWSRNGKMGPTGSRTIVRLVLILPAREPGDS